MPPNTGRDETHIIVVGAGVIGLTTANLLQEQSPEKTITIITAELPFDSPITRNTSSDNEYESPSADYASMWAGAHHRPIPYLTAEDANYHKLSGTQQRLQSQLAQEHKMTLRTADIMLALARCEPHSGVQIVPAAEYLEAPPPENVKLKAGYSYASSHDKFRVLGQKKLDVLNISRKNGHVKWGCEYETYVVNPHVYCQYLLHRFQARGGRIVKRRLHKLADALKDVPAAQHPLLVNCSGIGKFDVTDPETKIIRGQTVLVRNEFDKTLTRQCTDGCWSFLIPRPLGGGTIVGGTKQIGDEEAALRPAERRKLLEDAVRYFREFVSDVDSFDVVQDNVGFRPWRAGGMRIEIDNDVLDGQTSVVHGYGAGGRGYEMSWRAAEQICELVERCLQKPRAISKL